MNTAALLAAITLAALPAEPWDITASVDLIEVNTVLATPECPRFTQVMWCDLAPACAKCEAGKWSSPTACQWAIDVYSATTAKRFAST